MIIYGDSNKQALLEDYRAKADKAGQDIFDALVLDHEWPISGPDAGRKTREEAEASIQELTARIEYVTEKLSKNKASEISNVLTRFINLAVTHPELLPELRYAANSLKRW
jgi:hypothetical protein